MSSNLEVKEEESSSPSPFGTQGSTMRPPSPGVADQTMVENLSEKAERLSSFHVSTEDVKMDSKAEDEPSPSASPTLNDDFSSQNHKLSPTPTPPPSTTNGTDSMVSTPPLATTPTTFTAKKGQAPSVQLIGDLPIARDAALATFNEIPSNNYQFKSLGRSREALESMTFQNREYSNIEIVQTEKKGFGLRAEVDLAKDAFIYEYVGDVVNPTSFKKRMRDYANEGIQHFYFMMLQKDEFIDATKSGGIGRFANHSCKPNCYVAKWTVGHHVRMGIFAKRNVKKHEELTFNYNVDRYGHQAQTCYCGESNCVGFIGGKTQTDVVTMDDLYLDALGITDEADLMELKGSKKKKGKKIDDPDFMPTMKPIVEAEVPKVVQAIRQTQSRKVLYKLLTRIKARLSILFYSAYDSNPNESIQMTEDQAALRQIMRLRGYSLMTNLLADQVSENDLIQLALECMSTWPLLNRNKVEDSRVIVSVKEIAESETSSNKDLAQSLIDHWETLPTYNRIPKRLKKDDDDETYGKPSPGESSTYIYGEEDERYQKRSRGSEIKLWQPGISAPPRRTISNPYVRREREHSEIDLGKLIVLRPTSSAPSPPRKPAGFSKESILAVIAAAKEAEEEAAKEAAALAAAAAEKEEAEAAEALARAERKAAAAANGNRKKPKVPKKVVTEEEKEANKEKRLLKLVGAVVVKCMSKHSKAMDHDTFKKHAKELTQIIAEKEKKSSGYKEGRLDKLSDEKVVKIKKFAKEYIAKVLRKLAKSSGKRLHGSSSSTAVQGTSSTAQDTPNSNSADGDVPMGDMSMEDINAVCGSDDEGDVDGLDDDDDDEEEAGAGRDEPSASRSPQDDSLPLNQGDQMDVDMDVHPIQAVNVQVRPSSDPRRRPPIDPQASVWEPHQNGVSTS
ncbi:hypothetical protein H0H81_005815 [Sphagnurus paluster]|uniref:[histone H3]-lysine(36) N-trimethyltransferase n=1 Tax=Sphagnurus paluster TaxID=117069 RepID=A0A9P7FR96_9AGAR|nr:hypothetical protein H0H81_005815 [Sphagnurus paluster]